jgi:hypothetical protein
VANNDAAGGQQLLDHTQPERKPEIQPDGVANNLGRVRADVIIRPDYPPRCASASGRAAKLTVPSGVLVRRRTDPSSS